LKIRQNWRLQQVEFLSTPANLPPEKILVQPHNKKLRKPLIVAGTHRFFSNCPAIVAQGKNEI